MRSLLVILALAAAATASAQTSQQPFFNVVTIEASATADVPTDTLTVTMFAEEQGPDPAAHRDARQCPSRRGAGAGQEGAQGRGALRQLPDDPRLRSREPDHRLAHPRRPRARKPRLQGGGGARRRAAAGAQAVVDDVLAVARRARGRRGGAADRSARQVPGEGARGREGAGLPGLRARADRRAQRDGSMPPPVAFRGVAMSAMADGGAPPPPVPAEGGKNAVTVNVSGSVVLGPGARQRLRGARGSDTRSLTARIDP